jgi:hypothetical protein
MLFNSLTFIVFFVVRSDALLEHPLLECAEESAGDRELHLLRRLESALCRAPFFHYGEWIFWLGRQIAQSQGPALRDEPGWSAVSA